MLKLAERGALALADGISYNVPAVQVEKMIDPVGAGDGFNAGFLAGWLRGDSMEESLRLGARIGGGGGGHAGRLRWVSTA